MKITWKEVWAEYYRLIISALFAMVIVLLVWCYSLNMFLSQAPVKIGATYMTLNNSFYQIINEEVKKKVDQNGDILYTRDPGLSVTKQCQQINNFIKLKVNVIIINPVNGESHRLQVALRKAHQQGIRIVVVDSQVSDAHDVDTTVVSDNYRAGALDAQNIRQNYEQARVLVLRHWNALSVKERYQGLEDQFKKYPQYQIVKNVETLGQTDISLRKTKETLENSTNKYDLIVALDDQSALGALAALDELGVKRAIPVYGIDGSANMKRLLVSDQDAQATVAQSPIKLGQKSIQVSYKLVKNQKVARKITVPVYLLTKKNIKNYDLSGWQ